MEWLGRAPISFYHAPSTISLPLSDNSKKTTTLASLCADATPPCNLNPLLFNGHLQTMYTVVKSQAVPVHYRRHVFESTDSHYPGSFAVDFAVDTKTDEEDSTLHPNTTYYSEKEWNAIASDDETPMLIALHGLSGGSHELYLRHVLSPIINGEDTVTGVVRHRKWKALVVNARGCANSKITSPVLFNARASWDVRQVVAWCRTTFPNRPLFAVGFSLGGNILTNVRSVLVVLSINPLTLFASTLARKVINVSSRLLLCARILGTLKLVVWLCRGRGLVVRCTRRRWRKG
jgi:predicted alpha/beta-fold hydrolase